MGPNGKGRPFEKWKEVLRTDKKEKGIPEDGESFHELVQSREGWGKACNKGNRDEEGEVLESVQLEDEGECGTAAHAYDPGMTRRLT